MSTYLYRLNNCIHTKVLNKNVSNVAVSSGRTNFNKPAPLKLSIKMTVSWYIACPKIIFQPVIDISGVALVSGDRWRTAGFAGSVASASAANVSIIKLTQSNWAGERVDSPVSLATEDTNVSVTAVMFTVS